MSADTWTVKEAVVHTHNGVLFSRQKEWKHAICSSMVDPEIVTLREVGKRQMLHDVTYMWTQICHKRTYEGNQNRLPDEQACCCQGVEGGGGMDWEFGISRGKLLYIEWIRKRSSCTAQGTICNILWQTIMEKNLKKECLLFVYLTHFAVQKKWNITL